MAEFLPEDPNENSVPHPLDDAEQVVAYAENAFLSEQDTESAILDGLKNIIIEPSDVLADAQDVVGNTASEVIRENIRRTLGRCAIPEPEAFLAKHEEDIAILANSPVGIWFMLEGEQRRAALKALDNKILQGTQDTYEKWRKQREQRLSRDSGTDQSS